MNQSFDKIINRRQFIKQSGVALAATGIGLTSGNPLLGKEVLPSASNLPKWKGFNFLDFFSPDPSRARRDTPEVFFKWMSDWGFDFIRVPMAYPPYLDIDHSKPITPDEVYEIDEGKVAKVDTLVDMAHRQGLHVSLNLHRAPGYCINAGFREPYNLWKDREAQDAFCYHWSMWAKRYRGISSKHISFDLLNEPAMREDPNDQRSKVEALPPGLYHQVAKAASETIRAANPDHLIIADGNRGGHVAVPELADLNIAQSCRGYIPFNISHYQAPWVYKDPHTVPPPKWPDGEGANRAALEKLYQPWFDLKNNGVGVHCGECGGYNKTPHGVFLAWFRDVLELLSEAGIGFALWEMKGDFGILDSGRTDVDFEDWHG